MQEICFIFGTLWNFILGWIQKPLHMEDQLYFSSINLHTSFFQKMLQYSCVCIYNQVSVNGQLLFIFCQTAAVNWRRKWQPTPVFLPENPRDGGAWGAAVYGVAQSRTRLKRLSSSSCCSERPCTCMFAYTCKCFCSMDS